MRIGEAVRGRGLDELPRPLARPHAVLERRGSSRLGADLACEGEDGRKVVGVNQGVQEALEAKADGGGRVDAEDPCGRRALIANDPVGLHHRYRVVRVLHEGTKTRLALFEGPAMNGGRSRARTLEAKEKGADRNTCE